MATVSKWRTSQRAAWPCATAGTQKGRFSGSPRTSGTLSLAALSWENSTVSAGYALHRENSGGSFPMARGDPPLPRRRSLPRRRLNRSRAGGRALRTVPARGIAAAAAPRLARARAVSTVNRRGRYGSPSPRLRPGGSRPAARCGIGTNRTRPAGARQMPCSAGRPPASMGIWPSARARCVPAPEGTTARRRRPHVPCVAGTGVPSRGVRAGADHRLAGEETAPLQVDRKTRRNPVHAVPSVGR